MQNKSSLALQEPLTITEDEEQRFVGQVSKPRDDPHEVPLKRTHRGHRSSRAHHRECHPLAVAGAFLLIVVSTGAILLASIHRSQLTLNNSQQEINNQLRTLPLPCVPFSLLSVVSTYGISLLLAGATCLTACCAGQFECFALQAGILDLAIIFPLNVTLWVLFRVLTPFRFLWRHFLCWLVVPFVSIFHMRPSFLQSDLKKFVLAVPFAFRDLGMGNIYDAPENKVRLEMRAVMKKLFPRITAKWVPDVILCNTLFRLLLGFAMFPLAWWLCDEMYCVPMSSLEDKPLETIKESQSEGVDPIEEDDEYATNPNVPPRKDLDVTFVFPKCKFLIEARKTYADRIQGNKVCRRVCRLLIEELTGQALGHQWKVKPNMKTMRCTFTITTATFSPDEKPPTDGCGCSDPKLDW